MVEKGQPAGPDQATSETVEITDPVELIRRVAAGPIELPLKGDRPEQTNAKKEIEVKVRVERPEVVRAFVEASGKFVNEDHQRDDYYSPKTRDFLAVRPLKEWLRLRAAGAKQSVNYKNWYYDANGRASHCDEIEIKTKVEDAARIQTALADHHFKIIVTVDKTRRTYHFQDYEIAFDSVEKLGNFIEVEYVGSETNLDPQKTTDGMIAWLKNLGCGKVERDYLGYPVMLLFPSERDREEI